MLEKLKENKTVIIVGVAALLVGRFVLQPKGKVEIQKVVELKEVIKEVKVEGKKIVIIRHEVRNPDGTITIDTNEHEDTTTTTNTDTQVAQTTKESTKISTRGPSLGIIALEPLNKDAFKQNPEIGLTGSAPIYGSLSLTGLVTKERFGLGLSLEF